MFHVFVEGAVDASPAAIAQLAAAMAQRYGLPETELVARLARGRFRVKANVDRATAETYLRDLEAIGARVVIDPAGAPTPPAGTPAVPRTVTPLPPAPAISRTMTPLPPADASRPAQQVTSGLAAAYAQDAPVADLGALGSAGFSLASLDGSEAEAASPSGGFAPPDDAALPASIGPAARAPAPAAPPKPASDEPVDLFAPPDAAEQELAVDLATDELEERARKRATAPPATAPVAPDARASAPLLRRAPAEAVTSVASTEPPRWRLAAGVAVAIVLGFVPAHFVAASREASAYKSIDAGLVQRYASADTPEAYAELDRHFNDARDAKRSARRSIALTSMLIWAAAGGAVAYVWFRRIPWK